MSDYIFLSPHLDDVVLSCGAIVYDLVHRQHQTVKIWTIFSGDVPDRPLSPFARELHERWQTGAEAPRMRRTEDQLACSRLGAEPSYLMYPDCIYRLRQGTDEPLITRNEDLSRLNVETELALVEELCQKIARNLSSDATVIAPIGIGNHIDHLITRAVAEKLPDTRFFYADYPYVGSHPEEIFQRLPKTAVCVQYPLNNLSLANWQYAVEAYTSQISTFWPSISDMCRAVETYALSDKGNCLWKIS